MAFLIANFAILDINLVALSSRFWLRLTKTAD
jgi:hypothetical protein